MPSSGGISPVRSFQYRYRPHRLAKFPSSGGISPVRPLSYRYRLHSWPSRPVRPGSRPSGCCRPVPDPPGWPSFPVRAGSRPSGPLLLKFSCRRLAKLPSSAGTSPVRPFSLRSSRSKLAKVPSSAGTSPVRPFSLRSSRFRLAKVPSSAGTSPVRPLLPRLSSWTRPLASVETPCHPPSGASVSQLSFLVQFEPPVASYRATSTARSPAVVAKLSAAAGTASNRRLRQLVAACGHRRQPEGKCGRRASLRSPDYISTHSRLLVLMSSPSGLISAISSQLARNLLPTGKAPAVRVRLSLHRAHAFATPYGRQLRRRRFSARLPPPGRKC